MTETEEMQMMGYKKQYDYSQYAHDNHINVIPEQDFKRLVSDTFETIAYNLGKTYGPYGSSMMISEQSQTTTTKDGHNVFTALEFKHSFKTMVYRTILKIINRVNKNVGDGTTSCILLADKIFKNLKNIPKTPDDERQMLQKLTYIEQSLQSIEEINNDMKNGSIKRLTSNALLNLINMAANYDKELSNVIYEALSPQLEEIDGVEYVSSIYNVIPKQQVSMDGDSVATYNIEYLPGDYRIKVDISAIDAVALAEPTNVKIALYDHAFGVTDWLNFIEEYNDQPTIILARAFNHNFMNTSWDLWVKEFNMAAKFGKNDGKIKIYLAKIHSDDMQNEIKDIGVLLGTTPYGLHAKTVKHDTLPEADVSIFLGDCLSFHNMKTRDTIPEVQKHIELIKHDAVNDDSNSYIMQKKFNTRINALQMQTQDALLIVNTGTTLEGKLIMDKIDDCISIVNSALENGIVPNLFKYVYGRMKNLGNEYLADNDYLGYEITNSITNAIKELFKFIWDSKYGTDQPEVFVNECKVFQEIFYDKANDFSSFDIMIEKLVDGELYPTSTQYDLEVVVAALSIVKYLITSKGLIFDAHVIANVVDDGRYVQ